jgi:Zn-dependent M28 family amino/carboxypeptidase
VKVANAPLVFVGYGVVAPEYQWNDYAGVDVKGKTVVILINDPGNEDANPDPNFFKGKAMTYYGRWTYKYEEAARQGAAAALIVHETAPAAYGWQVVRNSNSGARPGSTPATGT